MNSFTTMLLQENNFKPERKLGEFVNSLLISGSIIAIPTFSFYFCALKWGEHCDFYRWCQPQWQRESDILGSFLGKIRMVVCLMTLFFQCWLYGSITLANIGWPWNVFKSKVSWMFCLLLSLRNANKIFSYISSSIPGWVPVYIMLAPRPHKEFKIKYYWKYNN